LPSASQHAWATMGLAVSSRLVSAETTISDASPIFKERRRGCGNFGLDGLQQIRNGWRADGQKRLVRRVRIIPR
jgi:hypothetical protein